MAAVSASPKELTGQRNYDAIAFYTAFVLKPVPDRIFCPIVNFAHFLR
jgi:hypothetical protein